MVEVISFCLKALDVSKLEQGQRRLFLTLNEERRPLNLIACYLLCRDLEVLCNREFENAYGRPV